jgi:hypothetical protein
MSIKIFPASDFYQLPSECLDPENIDPPGWANFSHLVSDHSCKRVHGGCGVKEVEVEEGDEGHPSVSVLEALEVKLAA